MNVSLDTLRKAIADCKGASFASIVARTEVKLTGGKANPLYGRVTKVARVHGMINWLYENSVNAKRDKEGQPVTNDGEIEKFIAEPRMWGKRLHLSVGNKTRLLPFVHHVKGNKRDGESHRAITATELDSLPNEELYVEFKPQASIEYQYFIDGQPVEKEMVESSLPDRSREGKTQGTDEVVRVRDYQLVSIIEMHLNGEVYTVDKA